MSHRQGQRSPQSVQRSEDCLVFFQVRRGLFLLSLSGSGFGLGGGGGLVAILGSVSYSTTEHTQVVIEAALSFLLSLPSFLSLSEREAELPEVEAGFPGLFFPEGLLLFLLELPEPDAGVLLLSSNLFLPSDLSLPSDLFFPAQDFSRLHSQ